MLTEPGTVTTCLVVARAALGERPGGPRSVFAACAPPGQSAGTVGQTVVLAWDGISQLCGVGVFRGEGRPSCV